MKPDGHTPAGASIYLQRNKSHTRVTVDRWPITDATAEQCELVRQLLIREWSQHVRNPRHSRMSQFAFLAQPSIWEGITTRERESDLLRGLIDIESRTNHDH